MMSAPPRRAFFPCYFHWHWHVLGIRTKSTVTWDALAWCQVFSSELANLANAEVLCPSPLLALPSLPPINPSGNPAPFPM